MADADVIIKADLKGEDLTRKIDQLVQDVDSKFSEMAQKIDDNVQLIKLSLGELGSTARAKVSEIKQAFTQLGTTFDQFARAMERAAAAANNVGGRGGRGGNGNGSGNAYAPDTIGALEQEIAAGKALRKEAKLYSDDLKDINNSIERQTRLLNQETKGQQKLTEEAKKTAQAQEKTRVRAAISMPTNDIKETERKLLRLQGTLQRLQHTRLLDESQINRVKNAIANTEKQLERLKAKAAIPTTMSGVLGMSERTLNDISAKMKAISSLRAQTPIGSADISRLNSEYARLSRLQSEIIGKNATLIESNNALGRAFNYIRNRLAFTLTVGAFTGFVRQLYEVRGQYELLERSLGVLVNSFQRGSQIFQELSSMAIKSPFTLIELGTAAKQLTAYNFKANEVVNVTKRMADIAAAVGVPMERLVYNLGQIRAQTVLTARDARDFANAGLPIASSLADMYSKLEGRVVSTGDVFDRMKKKAVSYNDVMTILNQMTDEGGKFFDFQAKQAGTLKVQLANLTLAWNNMLNAMGESKQGLLSMPIQGLKSLFENWKGINDAITATVIGLGAYKASQLVVNKVVGVSNFQLGNMIKAEARMTVSKYERIQVTRMLTEAEMDELAMARANLDTHRNWIAADYELALMQRNLSKEQAMRLVMFNQTNVQLHKALINMGLLTEEEVAAAAKMNGWAKAIKLALYSLKGFGRALMSMFVTAAPMLLIAAIFEIIFALDRADEAIKDINKDIIEGAKETSETLKKFAEDYDSLRKSLYKYDEKDPTKEIGTQDLPQEEAKKAWETMRSKIEESVSSASTFIAKLESIENINDRLREGFGLINSLKDAEGELQKIDESAIKISSTTLKGLFGEGLKDDLKDYLSSLTTIERVYGDVKKAQEELDKTDISVGIGNTLWDLQEINDEVQKFATSMAQTFTGEDLDLGLDAQRMAFEQAIQSVAEKQELTAEQTKVLRIKAEHEYYEATLEIYKRRLETETGAAREATKQKMHQLQLEFNTNKSLQETFFQWLSDTRSSETQKMLQNLTKEEIAAGKWMNDKNIAWIKEQARAFSNEYGVAFDDLWNYVKYANTWKIYIPVYFQTIGQISDLQKTFKDAGIDERYYQNSESTHEVLSQLKQDQKKVAEEIKASTNAAKKSAKYRKDYIDGLNKQNESLTRQIHALGGMTDAEEKAAKAQNKLNTKRNATANKAQKQAEDAVAKALKEEISVINQMQSAYDKLRKAGVGATDALTIASSGYDKTLKSINSILSKYGIAPFKAEDFVGSSDPHKLLNALQSQLNTLIASGKVKTISLKDLEAEIQKITVDAKEYDMKKITDGLNNELGKIKEEYELAVELDANPELGGIFADMMGISEDELKNLPKDWEQVMAKMQSVIDQKLGKGKFDLLANLNKADFDAWVESQGKDLESNFAEVLNKIREMVNKTRLDESKKLIEEWDKLLEEYAEYEYKRTKIIEEGERKRKIALKKGAGADVIDAINKKTQQNLAKHDFDEFQKSPTWITATSNLSNLADSALELLIKRLVEYRKKAKNLDPKEILKLNKALRQLRKEQMKDNPFKIFSIAAEEAKERAEEYDAEIAELQKQVDALGISQKRREGIVISQEDLDKLKELLDKISKLKEEKEEVGKVPLIKKVEQIKSYVDLFKQASDAFKSFADTTTSHDMKQVAKAISDVVDVVSSALQGAASMGGWWGAVIGGLSSLIPKILDWTSGNDTKNYLIDESQLAIKRLTNSYKELEYAAQKAYGVEAYGAQKAMIYNKQLQLQELEHQLQLEESRKGKYRDRDAIAELKGQIIDMKNEINDATENIVNDLLGISSKADFAENLVSSMIQAFKAGEDYMKVFEDSFEDMVDNMIMKAIVSRLVGDWINKIWDSVQMRAMETDRAKDAEREVQRLQRQLEYFKSGEARKGGRGSLSEEELARAIAQTEEALNNAIQAYNEAITPTPEDVASMREFFEQGRDDFKNNFLAYMDAFGITFGQDAGKADLSALQQGIQGITEETAGALEAYMNGVSQQVYYQSDILTQIRDILVNFGGDVTIATNAQILFELQQSYQVQMSIQSILQGWSSASGLAVKVEMI